MTSAMAHIAVLIVVPIAITCLMFVGRKELWRAIALFSVISIFTEAINVTLWILQLAHSLPYASSGDITFVDGIRTFASGFADYLGATAWVLCIVVCAQQRQMFWALVLTVMGVLSVCSLYIIEYPYSFFTQTGYARGYEVLLLLLIHVSTVLTLIFGLLNRPRRKMDLQQPAINTPPPSPYAG